MDTQVIIYGGKLFISFRKLVILVKQVVRQESQTTVLYFLLPRAHMLHSVPTKNAFDKVNCLQTQKRKKKKIC